MFDFLEFSKDILSINDRNISLIHRFNPFKYRRIANDKLLTKSLLLKNNINTPKLIFKIKDNESLEKFNFNKLPESFVIKPRRGFGGQGILVFFSKDKFDNWVQADKTRYNVDDIKSHIKSILEGSFSLGYKPDIAFFEERITVIPEFKNYVYRGVPDIRIIVFNKIPLMAMLRLPTKESQGKANLHLGGVAAGIDLSTGLTFNAIHHDKIIKLHPDTGASLESIKIPYWKEILELAVKAQSISGLGYVGVDIVIDKVKGPMILELNARPGLAIQIANLDGLNSRIKKVYNLKVKDISSGVKIAQNLFGIEELKEDKYLGNKLLIGRLEKISFIDLDKNLVTVDAKVDTGAWRSSIDKDLAIRLGLVHLLEKFDEFISNFDLSDYKEARKVRIKALRILEDEKKLKSIALIKQISGFQLRPIVKLSFFFGQKKYRASYTITNRSGMKFPVILGRNFIRNKFIVDTSKKFLIS